jgi:hypothetical protein
VPGQSWLADILARIAAMPQIGLMRRKRVGNPTYLLVF